MRTRDIMKEYAKEFKRCLIRNGATKRSDIKKYIIESFGLDNDKYEFSVMYFNDAENYLLENLEVEVIRDDLFIHEEKYKIFGCMGS